MAPNLIAHPDPKAFLEITPGELKSLIDDLLRMAAPFIPERVSCLHSLNRCDGSGYLDLVGFRFTVTGDLRRLSPASNMGVSTMSKSSSQPAERLLDDVRGLSSGTISALSGAADYAAIEHIQAGLLTLAINAMSDDPEAFSSWVDAWTRLVRAEAANFLAKVSGAALPARRSVLDLSLIPGDVCAEAAALHPWPGEPPGVSRFLLGLSDRVSVQGKPLALPHPVRVHRHRDRQSEPA
jgi:hypothetical protein